MDCASITAGKTQIGQPETLETQALINPQSDSRFPDDFIWTRQPRK